MRHLTFKQFLTEANVYGDDPTSEEKLIKILELQSYDEVRELEAHLDALMRTVGLDVEFSRHFIERLLGREKRVTQAEIVRAFAKLKGKYKKRLLSAKKKPDYEAVLKDFSNDLNIVFGIRGGELMNVTIKRKDPSTFHLNTKGGDELRV